VFNFLALIFTYWVPIRGDKYCERTRELQRKQIRQLTSRNFQVTHNQVLSVDACAAADAGGVCARKRIELVQIPVPAGCIGGETVSVVVKGKRVQVKIPQGVQPGQTVDMEVQAQAHTHDHAQSTSRNRPPPAANQVVPMQQTTTA
jgi:hypothetical protein